MSIRKRNIRSVDVVNDVQDYVTHLPEQGFSGQLRNISNIDAEIDKLAEELNERRLELRRARERLYLDVQKNYSEDEVDRARRSLLSEINA